MNNEQRTMNEQPETTNERIEVREISQKKKRRGLWWKIPVISLVVILGLGGLVAWQAQTIYKQALGLKPVIEKAEGNLKSQDLPALKQTLSEMRSQAEGLKNSYRQLSWAKVIPLAGNYVKDGDHALAAGVAGIEAGQIMVDAIEPYADVLGFKGSGSFTGGTAEDRIVTILGTLEKVTPKLDDVAAKLKVVDGELSQIDENRYQYELNGKSLAKEIGKVKEAVHGVTSAVTDAKPAIVALPRVAGMEGEKKYMVMFHNDGELRGAGGFMTAYGILRVDKGRVFPEKSSDIYDLDAKFKSRLQPPDLVARLLNVKYWYLRDLNLSPDYKADMEMFDGYYSVIPGEPKINGIVGVDTNFLTDLLGLLGPIDVPGYGRFSNDIDPRCNCPQVVYQLELIADRPVATLVENRKGVLGPLMRELVVKAYGAPKAWWDDLFKIFIKNAAEKHLVFYFHDDEFQNAAEQLGAAGRVENTDGDYLLIDDVNFGGAKANFFVTQDVKQQLQVGGDGTITKTLTITYTNPAPASNCNLEAGQLCLNAPLPNWVRIYVPKGSELVESVGLDDKAKVGEDLDKTVFEGFVKINPQSSAKTIYTYKLPWKAKQAPGNLVIQKQVGKDSPHYQVELPNRLEEFDLTGDKILIFNW